jgi:DNA replication regulator SLD3
MNDLVAFLEGLLFTTSLLDKKYKDGLPTCIALLDIVDHSGNDATNLKTKKRKSTKKMKAGKAGLYPNEDEFVRKWWSSHDDDFEVGVPGRTREDLTKSRLADLRIRETQLQMILILEILALKPLATVVQEDTLGLPSDSQGVTASKSVKSRKTEDLSILMDVHIDRLCIWQSLSLETVKAENSDSQLTITANKHTENITRDFCVDIIAPL